MRVFLDTNVLAAAFAVRGLCSDLMREVIENHEFVCTTGILKELRRILDKKFKMPNAQVDEIIEFVTASVEMSSPVKGAAYDIKDLVDVPHLSAAESSGSDVFVTGDKELWKVSPLGKMSVCSPRGFWEKISGR